MVGGDLLNRLPATDRLHGDPGLELGTVGTALVQRWEALHGQCSVSEVNDGGWPEKPDHLRHRIHQQRRSVCPAPVADSVQDHPWRPIQPGRSLPQPPAQGYNYPQAIWPGYLAVLGAGLDNPLPQRRCALIAAGSLSLFSIIVVLWSLDGKQ